MAINIIIAGDYKMRDCMPSMLSNDSEIVIIGEASTGEEAVVLTCELKPDIILIDLDMPDMNGITAAHIIRDRFPCVRVLFLTECGEDEEFFASMETGAMGYIVKKVNISELVKIIKSVYRGDVMVSHFLARLTFNYRKVVGL
ncbi:MAG: response regulator transcription factor [Nitrospirota bacterium]